jgi:fermentation-respiration switch protein FrsA (DUF1100 family)
VPFPDRAFTRIPNTQQETSMIRFDPASIASRLGGAWNTLTTGRMMQGPGGAALGAAPRAASPAPINIAMNLSSLAGTLLSRPWRATEVAVNVPVAPEPNQCSVLNMARELAPLAQNSYNPSAIPGFELSRTVLGTEGFAAAVYKGRVGGREQMVIAFRGTEDSADWKQNFASNFMVPSQYRQAVDLVRQVQGENPGMEIILTGHSLGGALAAYAGILRGEPAVIFNAAGTDGPQSAALGPGMNTSAENVVQVNASCDPLTQNPASRRVAGQPWNRNASYVAESQGSAWGTECHSMENLTGVLRRTEELLPAR